MEKNNQSFCALAVSLVLGVTPIVAYASKAKADKTQKIALVVADQNCPLIVQPYDMTGNALVLGTQAVKNGISVAGKKVWNKLYPKKAEAVDTKGISADARLTAKRLNWLPMQTEVLYGERAHAQETKILARESKQGKKLYPVADTLLSNILAGVGEPYDYEFKLFILKNATRNAVARPGGFLYIDQGLLDDKPPFRKANFALAHEIAHVLQRHETKELQSMVVDSFTAADQMKKAIAKAKEEPGALLDNIKVGKDIYSRHHADQELQADSCAARLLSTVYPEPRDLAGTLDAFLKELPPVRVVIPETAPQTKEAELAATAHTIVATPADRHPDTNERRRNLDDIYREITAMVLK